MPVGPRHRGIFNFSGFAAELRSCSTDRQQEASFQVNYCRILPHPKINIVLLFQIREGVNEFLEEGNLLRVRIQWELVRQMFQATVHQGGRQFKRIRPRATFGASIRVTFGGIFCPIK